jgi:hypothetical protein
MKRLGDITINTDPLSANLPKPVIPKTFTPSVPAPAPVKEKKSVWDVLDNVTDIFTKVSDKIAPYTPGINPSAPTSTNYSENLPKKGVDLQVGMSTGKKIAIGAGVAVGTGLLVWGVATVVKKKKKKN